MNEKNRWFEKIFDNSGVGILIVDKYRTILEINETFCKILGYEYEELVNKHASVLHLNEESSNNFTEITKKILDSQPLDLEYKIKHKRGNPIWVKITGDRIDNKDDILWIITDITEKIKAQEELFHLNETLNEKIQIQLKTLREKDRQLQYQDRLAKMGEMLNMISHQWKQPLMSISATTSYLYGKISLDEYDKNDFLSELTLLEDSAQHLSSTITDFRNFFKHDKVKVLTTFENIVNSTLKIIKPILSINHIDVQTIFNSNKNIYSLENELRQVVLNILKNAEDEFIKNNLKNRKIIIETYYKDGFSFLEIKDNAGGIKTDNINKIFDSYFTTKSSIGGTGLGLCISKTIVKKNCHGDIWAENNDINGATITIKLSINK
jgi:PAS domain S-box-containing protein